MAHEAAELEHARMISMAQERGMYQDAEPWDLAGQLVSKERMRGKLAVYD